jgi:hypothetical protein
MNKQNLLLALTFCTALSLSAQTILSDNFNADLGGTNPNPDLTLDTASRQIGGTTTTAYTKNGNTDAFLNTPGGDSFIGQTVLLLRTESTGGLSPSNSGVTTNTNFATSLAGNVYNIQVTGLISIGGTPSGDHWGSIFLTDNGAATGPNAAGTDYGLLYRERDTDNFTVWKDGVGVTSTQANGGTSLFDSASTFTLDILVDEVLGIVQTTINKGTVTEIALAGEGITFDNSTDRYFGFRANQGSATGLVDFRYDNFSVSLVPEPSAYALLSGLLALSWVMVRRRC